MKKYSLLLLLAFVFGVCTAQQPVDHCVRFIYLVSKDREMDPAYKKAIEHAAVTMQAWYKQHMGGWTFRLNNPIVEVVYSDKAATYFYGHPKNDVFDNWGYRNTYDECNRLLGTVYNDPKYIWVIYSDGPGASGRGTSGVCIMPENDLLGLVGKAVNFPDPNRWIGGMGHELGHALGLPHPTDTKTYEDDLMWTGFYYKFPDGGCYLSEDDKVILRKSPFMFNTNGEPATGSIVNLEKFSRRTGTIQRMQNTLTKEVTWTQTTDNGNSIIYFIETKCTPEAYYLKRIKGTTSFELIIPVNGGMTRIYTVDRPEWTDYEVFKKL